MNCCSAIPLRYSRRFVFSSRFPYLTPDHRMSGQEDILLPKKSFAERR